MGSVCDPVPVGVLPISTAWQPEDRCVDSIGFKPAHVVTLCLEGSFESKRTKISSKHESTSKHSPTLNKGGSNPQLPSLTSFLPQASSTLYLGLSP